MGHSFTSNIQHIVFATKERRQFIDEALESRLHPYLGGICRQLGGQAIRINGWLDHVHLLAILPATLAPSEAACKLKGSSSKWIHDTFPRRQLFGWQRGYGSFSVSRSRVADVASYIERQKEHHREATFEDEFEELLRLHEVEFDRRYLWVRAGNGE